MRNKHFMFLFLRNEIMEILIYRKADGTDLYFVALNLKILLQYSSEIE